MAELSTTDEQVLRRGLPSGPAAGYELTGEGGLLGRLTQIVIEGALEGGLERPPRAIQDQPEGPRWRMNPATAAAPTVMPDQGESARCSGRGLQLKRIVAKAAALTAWWGW